MVAQVLGDDVALVADSHDRVETHGRIVQGARRVFSRGLEDWRPEFKPKHRAAGQSEALFRGATKERVA
jgi:hypothetical protein